MGSYTNSNWYSDWSFDSLSSKEVDMVQRMYPQEYFLQTNNNTMLYLGLIVLGIVACVAIVAIAYLRR